MTKWLDAKEAAEALGVSLRTLARYDESGVTVPYQNIANGPRFYIAEDIAKIPTVRKKK